MFGGRAGGGERARRLDRRGGREGCGWSVVEKYDLIRKLRSRPGAFCIIVRHGEKTNPAWATWRFVFTVNELLHKFTAVDKPVSIAGLT